MPQRIRRCEKCFINIFDEREHLCFHHFVTAIRPRVYVKHSLKMFDFKMAGTIYTLDLLKGRFKAVGKSTKFMSPATDGILSFEITGDLVDASYEASAFKCFSIIFTRFVENEWTCFLRVETLPSGLKISKMNRKLTMTMGRITVPDDLKLSTISILAISPKSIRMDFNVFANKDGKIDYGHFNGYTSSYLIGNQTEIEVR